MNRNPMLLVVVSPLIALACSREPASQAPVTAAGAPPAIDRVTPLPVPIPEVVARVNGVPVPRGPVLALAVRGLRGSVSADAERPGAVRQAMHQFIIRELLLQEAMTRGISASSQEVDAALDASRSSLKDEKAWAAKLAEEGLDPTTYRDELRAQKTVSALLAKIVADIPAPTEQEASAFYTTNPALFWQAEVFKMSRILVAVPKETTPEQKAAARKTADEVAAKLKSGAPFKEVARKSSDDPEARKTGGLMPTFSRGQGIPAVEDALLAMKVGEVSAVIETPAGLEIVLLHERTDGRTAAFEEVKAQVQESLRQQGGQARMQALVNSLRAKARIETYI